MAGRAELTVAAGLGDFGQQVFVDVAADVAFLDLRHLGIDVVEHVHDFVQNQRRGQLEDSVVHVFGIGAVFVRVKRLDEREDPFLHVGIHLSCGEIAEDGPLQVAAGGLALADENFFRKDAAEGQAEHGGFLRAEVVGVVEIVDEHEVGDLLDHVQRVHEAARCKDVPKAVDAVFQFAGNHMYRS